MSLTTMRLVDTHVHINFPDYGQDLTAVRRRWQEAGVCRLIHACVTPEDFSKMQAIADQFPEVSLAVGVHPLNTAEFWQEDSAEQISTLAQSDPRVVAIGETGLDFYKAENQREQITAFQHQLRIAEELNLPVIIHCRDSAQTTYEVLKDFPRVRGVMHCWAGNPVETEWFLGLGMYISFSGIITFKNAKQVHESCKIVPSDRLLIETDCPFLAPHPQRGKRNEPALVQYVAQRLAELRNTEVWEIAEQTTNNAFTLFNLWSREQVLYAHSPSLARKEAEYLSYPQPAR
jgi:TatD DNase family protein